MTEANFTELFLRFFNTAVSAGWLVLAVLALRVLLRRAPRWTAPALWAVVGLRLALPFSIESALSLIPSRETVPPEILMARRPAIQSGVPALDRVVNPVVEASFTPDPAASANPLQIWAFLAAIVWVAGIAALLGYALLSSVRLHWRVRTAVRLRGRVYQSEWVDSPFVLGLFRPRIFLPFDIAEEDAALVIAHEEVHLRRRDHWWKPLGFLLLSLYWFQPLLWIAYVLLCRDIELACDERVVRDLDASRRADYSQALLRCSVKRTPLAACPLAFGEVGVKRRVKDVLRYKKPAVWITCAAVVAVAIVAVCFLTDPKAEAAEPEVRTWFDYRGSDTVWNGPVETELPEYPGVVFRANPERITAVADGVETGLIGGMSIWSCFFTDLTGDGKPELCASLSLGSGIVDDRVVVYDYSQGAYYELSDRMNDYTLTVKDGELVVSRRSYPGGSELPVSVERPAAVGRLVLEDGKLSMVVEADSEPPVESGVSSGTVRDAWAAGAWKAFAEEAGLPEEFRFLSGAGAWSTELYINKDGTFTGRHYDSEMGEMSLADPALYPYGTVYECVFSGSFTVPEQVEDTIWSVRVAKLKYDPPETETIKEGIRHITTVPYGLENADKILICLPGTPVDFFSEEARSWLNSAESFWGAQKPEVLPFCALLNVIEQTVFFSDADPSGLGLTYTLPEGLREGPYSIYNGMAGGVIFGPDAYEGNGFGDAPVWWYAAGMASRYFTEGAVRWDGDRIAGVDLYFNHTAWEELGPLEGLCAPAYLVRASHDLYTAGSLGALSEQGVDLESIETVSEYWYVFFARPGEDTGYVLSLNAKNFSREDMIAFAKSAQWVEE